MPKQFPIPAKQRLQDTRIPSIDVSDPLHPALQKVPQIPGFGYANCTPQDMGRKLQQSMDGVNKHSLMQNVAHAKRWVREKVTAYVDGYLPTWLRRPKYVADVARLIQYFRGAVATARFLESLRAQEIAGANHYIDEANAMITLAESTLTPEGQMTAAERELATVLRQAKTDLGKQGAENQSELRCYL